MGAPSHFPCGDAVADRWRLRWRTHAVYAPDEIPERNQPYEMGKYCPGWLTIGDDGGGGAIVVAPDEWPTPVHLVDHGSMSRADFVEVAQDPQEWVHLGCKWNL